MRTIYSVQKWIHLRSLSITFFAYWSIFDKCSDFECFEVDIVIFLFVFMTQLLFVLLCDTYVIESTSQLFSFCHNVSLYVIVFLSSLPNTTCSTISAKNIVLCTN